MRAWYADIQASKSKEQYEIKALFVLWNEGKEKFVRKVANHTDPCVLKSGDNYIPYDNLTPLSWLH